RAAGPEARGARAWALYGAAVVGGSVSAGMLAFAVGTVVLTTFGSLVSTLTSVFVSTVSLTPLVSSSPHATSVRVVSDAAITMRGVRRFTSYSCPGGHSARCRTASRVRY